MLLFCRVTTPVLNLNPIDKNLVDNFMCVERLDSNAIFTTLQKRGRDVDFMVQLNLSLPSPFTQRLFIEIEARAMAQARVALKPDADARGLGIRGNLS